MTKYLIYYIDEPLSEEQLQEMLAGVSEQRREKVLKMRFPLGRTQSLYAYVLLQRLLREVYGITEPPVFRELENGKPVMVGHEEIHFNMSHCKTAVACAVSDHPVGIDVETVPEKYNPSLAQYVFSDEEVAEIEQSSNPCLAFARYWTMKEATVKQSGRGITGKQQLRPLLDEWRKGTSPLTYHTEEFPDKGCVLTLCEKLAKLDELCE